MSLGNLLSSLAPVAAGFMTGGSSLAFAPLLAGAATGAGIAALRDEDPLMGAITGGIGGYGGGGLRTAAGNVASASGAGPVNLGNASVGEAAKTLVTNPSSVISDLGGGDISKGALKAGAVGLPAVAGAMVPDMTTAEENQMAKYDPNRRLNLNMNTGLRLLQDGGFIDEGPGDGMSDEIMGNIDGTQPVRLSEGEFVVPADVVSHLGNGDSDSGAEQLYAMMDRIRQARTGTTKQGKQIEPEGLMPA